MSGLPATEKVDVKTLQANLLGMRLWLSISAGLAAMSGLAASPAAACRIAPANPRALIHAALPHKLPAGALVAEIEVDPDRLNTWVLHQGGLRVRVRRMLQGHYAGSELILRQIGIATDCDGPAANGYSGFIVAAPVGYENGVLVADPVMVPRADGFRLPDGFQLPRP